MGFDLQGVVGALLMGYLLIIAQTSVPALFLAFIFCRPFGEKAFLFATVWLQNSFLAPIVFLIELVGIELRITGDKPVAEPALVLPNHQTHDWVVMYPLAARIGTLGLVRTVIKKIIAYVPGFGWGMYFCYWPFVSRNYEKDVHYMKQLFGTYKRCALPVQLWLYAEGTRLTKRKLKEAQDLAREKGYPIWNHVLIPRYRGFTMAVESLKGVVSVIHDITIAYEGWGNPPSLWQLLTTKRSKKHVIHVHLKRVPLTDVPESDDGKKQWLMDCFGRKEALLAHYAKNNSFPGTEVPLSFSPATLIPHIIGWSLGAFLMYWSIYRVVFA